jgi:hypothetical protein
VSSGRLIDYGVPNGGSRASINRYPDTCPVCMKAIEATFHIAAATSPSSRYIQAVFQCPRVDCRSFIIAYYHKPDSYSKTYLLSGVNPTHPGKVEFSNEIQELSPNFVHIYNQAFAAEQYQLDEICGPGYRKALEFLIKDYACSEHPSDEAEIKKAFLAACIKQYIEDVRIQQTAKRATWLGNDETHYVRKWSDKDIQDLKVLIRLTVNWIENVILTNRYSSDMAQS